MTLEPPARQITDRDEGIDRQFVQVRTDLTWYFNHSEAALGLRSLQGSFEHRCRYKGASSTDPDPYTDGLLFAIRKHKRIRRVLFSLPRDIRRALEATYDQSYRFPPELVRIYGSKVGCALFNRVCKDLKDLCRLAKLKTSRKLSADQQKVSFLIGDDVAQRWKQIHRAYLDTYLRLHPKHSP